MTKSKKVLIAGAALAGLLAGTTAPVYASTLLPRVKASFSAQDEKKEPDEAKKKDKHACAGKNSCKGKGGCKTGDNGCKGKNSCKGKGGCRTDGKPMEKEKPPSFA